jgi:hypothetical protein
VLGKPTRPIPFILLASDAAPESKAGEQSLDGETIFGLKAVRDAGDHRMVDSSPEPLGLVGLFLFWKSRQSFGVIGFDFSPLLAIYEFPRGHARRS